MAALADSGLGWMAYQTDEDGIGSLALTCPAIAVACTGRIVLLGSGPIEAYLPVVQHVTVHSKQGLFRVLSAK